MDLVVKPHKQLLAEAYYVMNGKPNDMPYDLNRMQNSVTFGFKGTRTKQNKNRLFSFSLVYFSNKTFLKNPEL